MPLDRRTAPLRLADSLELAMAPRCRVNVLAALSDELRSLLRASVLFMFIRLLTLVNENERPSAMTRLLDDGECESLLPSDAETTKRREWS